MKKFNKNSITTFLAVVLMLGLSGQIASAASSDAVNLGSASNFAILAKTGISTTGSTAVTGNLGLSPAAASYITGFALSLPSFGAFSNSALVTGKIYASDYTSPTPSNLITAVLDMQNAYTDAMGRAPGVTELGAGNIGGMTLAPNVYKWGTGLTIPTDVTLSGDANDVWIFKVAQNLNVSSGVKIILAGGAKANNVFWVVAGQTIIGTTAVFNGNILDQTAIVLNTGAVLNGRALAQTAVTLDSNKVSIPESINSITTLMGPTANISASPSSIVNGSPAIISWSSTNTTSCTGTNFSTGNVVSGSVSVSPMISTKYSVNCNDAEDDVIVTVTQTTPTLTQNPYVAPTLVSTPDVHVTPVTSESSDNSLSPAQQQRYNQLVAVGVNPAFAFNAIKQVANSSDNSSVKSEQTNSSSPNADFGQQVRMIARSLGHGGRGNDVQILQQFLISQNKGSATRALAKVGATAYFGPMTRAALAEFQASVGISPALGNFGPVTRGYLNSHY